MEVLVVDSGPSTDAARRISEAAGVRYVLEPVPGLSRARNVAWQQAAAEVVAYLDDDAQPEPGWLSALVLPFADKAVMAVTGQVLPPFFHSAGTKEFRLDASAPGWRERTLFGGAGSGTNMAFRRSFFERWGGFDERIGCGRILSGGEEHEAFYCVLERGFALAYAPDAVVNHPRKAEESLDPRVGFAFAIHLFIKYRPLRGWLLHRTLQIGLGKSGTPQIHPAGRHRPLLERFSIAIGGCAVFLRNWWASASAAASGRREPPRVESDTSGTAEVKARSP